MMLVSPEVFAWQYLDAGVKLLEAGRFADAIANFNECLRYTPNDDIAHWNLAIALLCAGDYKRGFVELEYRWRVFDWCWGLLDRGTHKINKVPDWRGEDIRGKGLLYLHEQGFGDAILMMRFLPALLKTGADITAMTVEPLRRMLEQFGIKCIVGLPEDFSAYPYRCPVFGPMVVWGLEMKDIPAAPYIPANFRPVRGSMGICWSGRSQKTFTADSFLAFLEHDDYDLFSLQPDEPPPSVKPLAAKDFVDTLRLMETMEHIVTIDSAVANLAGAIGHPSTHLLLTYRGDWRWYNAAAWFPTVKTYRQEAPGDWLVPFARLNANIRRRGQSPTLTLADGLGSIPPTPQRCPATSL